MKRLFTLRLLKPGLLLTLCLLTCISFAFHGFAEDLDKPSQQYAEQVVNIFGQDYTIDFETYRKVHEQDFYSWDDLGQLIPELFPEFREAQDKTAISEVGAMLNKHQKSYLKLYQQQLYKLGEQVLDEGNLDIITAGITKDFDPFGLLVRVDSELPYMPRDRQVDFLHARFGTWFMRNENWREYIEVYNSALAPDTTPVDPNAFYRVHTLYRYYKAISMLKELIAASPEYTTYREKALQRKTE